MSANGGYIADLAATEGGLQAPSTGSDSDTALSEADAAVAAVADARKAGIVA
jgi:hypothetical protein